MCLPASFPVDPHVGHLVRALELQEDLGIGAGIHAEVFSVPAHQAAGGLLVTIVLRTIQVQRGEFQGVGNADRFPGGVVVGRGPVRGWPRSPRASKRKCGIILVGPGRAGNPAVIRRKPGYAGDGWIMRAGGVRIAHGVWPPGITGERENGGCGPCYNR